MFYKKVISEEAWHQQTISLFINLKQRKRKLNEYCKEFGEYARILDKRQYLIVNRKSKK